jgi:hypothetical protein
MKRKNFKKFYSALKLKQKEKEKKMIYFEITDIATINYFASIFLNLTIVVAPLFGALALTRH